MSGLFDSGETLSATYERLQIGEPTYFEFGLEGASGGYVKFVQHAEGGAWWFEVCDADGHRVALSAATRDDLIDAVMMRMGR